MDTEQMKISVTNIGGIDETVQTFEPGVTILAGRNATNRTSFLQAVMAVFGSNRASLKGDADNGLVQLTLNGDEYTRTLSRTNGRVSYSGDPYLEDAEVADLFAFLTETNETRLAIPRGDDLRDIIMQPVDTAAIQAEIRDLEKKKREIDSEIEDVEALKDRVPELQERLAQRQQKIEEKSATLEEKEAELETLDTNIEETRAEKSEVEETFTELREARQALEDLQYRLETKQESLKSLEKEQEDIEVAWEELETVSESRLSELDETLQRLREEKQAVESEVSTFQQVIQFNDKILEGASTEVGRSLRQNDGERAESVTNQLLTESDVLCWTCGSQVEKSAIEETLADLRDLLSEKHDDVRELETEISEIRQSKKSVEARQKRAKELSQKRREIEDEIERRTQSLTTLRGQIETQSKQIEQLETEAESIEDESYSEILEVHKEANQLEFELDRLRKETSEIENELADSKDQIGRIETLEERRRDVVSEIRELRDTIGRLEGDAVDAFNEHMAEILEILSYKNIDRIWLERTTEQVRSGRGTAEKTVFDVHIVRSTAKGTTYEDTLDHLSESERKVTGLIFALAGYLVHDVYESLPVMLLDSLEAIDSARIGSLIEYFEGYTEYLFVALLPEDASSLDEEYTIVESLSLQTG